MIDLKPLSRRLVFGDPAQTQAILALEKLASIRWGKVRRRRCKYRDWLPILECRVCGCSITPGERYHPGDGAGLHDHCARIITIPTRR